MTNLEIQILIFPEIFYFEDSARKLKEVLLVWEVRREAAVPGRVEVLQVQAAFALDLGRNGRVDDSVAALNKLDRFSIEVNS